MLKPTQYGTRAIDTSSPLPQDTTPSEDTDCSVSETSHDGTGASDGDQTTENGERTSADRSLGDTVWRKRVSFDPGVGGSRPGPAGPSGAQVQNRLDRLTVWAQEVRKGCPASALLESFLPEPPEGRQFHTERSPELHAGGGSEYGVITRAARGFPVRPPVATVIPPHPTGRRRPDPGYPSARRLEKMPMGPQPGEPGYKPPPVKVIGANIIKLLDKEKPSVRTTIGVELEMVLHGIAQGTDEFALLVDRLAPLEAKVRRKCAIQRQCDFGFRVHRDSSVENKTDEGYGKPIEVTTPVLYNLNWKWVIPGFITTLKGCARIAFNDTSALHVHIGIGRPYSLRDLRQFCKAVILFEEQIDLIHPNGRVPAPGTESHFKSCRYNVHFREMTAWQALGVLDGVETIGDLAFAINPGKRGEHDRNYKYSLASLWNYGTIEFRQAKGTTEPAWILGWIDTVIKFVTVAVQTSDRQFSLLARRGITAAACREFGILNPQVPEPENPGPLLLDDQYRLDLIGNRQYTVRRIPPPFGVANGTVGEGVAGPNDNIIIVKTLLTNDDGSAANFEESWEPQGQQLDQHIEEEPAWDCWGLCPNTLTPRDRER